MGTYHAIVFFPLIGAAIAGLFGRLIGDRQAEYFTTGLLILSALLSCISLINIGMDGGTQKIMVLNWISSGGLDIDWVLRIDALTAVMLVVITCVSSLVHVYSIGYMSHDPHRARFFALRVLLGRQQTMHCRSMAAMVSRWNTRSRVFYVTRGS